MPYGRIDDGFHGHPKRRLVSLAADGLLVRAISRSSHYSTNGFVEDSWVAEQSTTGERRKALQAAIEHQLLEPFPAGSVREIELRRPGRRARSVTVGPFPVDGFLVHDFLVDNQADVEVREQREKATAKKRKQRSGEPR